MFKKFRDIIVGVVLGVFITATLGYMLPHQAKGADIDISWPFSAEELAIIKQVKRALKDYQVDANDPDKINDEKIFYGVMKGLVSSVGDPYTRYINPKDLEDEEMDMKGEYGGLGMYIGMRNGRVTVIAPMEGTPAERVGLKPLDEIVKIDGKTTIDMNTGDAVRLMRGKPGTSVEISVHRKDSEKLLNFTIVRELIKIQTVRMEMIGNDIAYIKINQFNMKTDKDVQNAILSANKNKAKGLLIDLRNNPGGLLTSCVDVASQFLDGGLVVSTKGRFEKANDKLYADEGRATKLPVVVLVNEGSASASEILTGAIKDRKRGTIVGTKTFGKGSVQSLYNLPDKSGVYITIARYATPSGFVLDHIGLEPDIKIEGEIEKDKSKDKQLQKAVSVLRSKISPNKR